MSLSAPGGKEDLHPIETTLHPIRLIAAMIRRNPAMGLRWLHNSQCMMFACRFAGDRCFRITCSGFIGEGAWPNINGTSMRACKNSRNASKTGVLPWSRHIIHPVQATGVHVMPFLSRKASNASVVSDAFRSNASAVVVGDQYVEMTVDQSHALPQAQDDAIKGWRLWNGGRCPLGQGELHEIRLRNGLVQRGTDPYQWYWRHTGIDCDIVAFRSLGRPARVAHPGRRWIWSLIRD